MAKRCPWWALERSSRTRPRLLKQRSAKLAIETLTQLLLRWMRSRLDKVLPSLSSRGMSREMIYLWQQNCGIMRTQTLRLPSERVWIRWISHMWISTMSIGQTISSILLNKSRCTFCGIAWRVSLIRVFAKGLVCQISTPSWRLTFLRTLATCPSSTRFVSIRVALRATWFASWSTMKLCQSPILHWVELAQRWGRKWIISQKNPSLRS